MQIPGSTLSQCLFCGTEGGVCFKVFNVEIPLNTHKRGGGLISPLLLLTSFSNYQLMARLVPSVDSLQPSSGLLGIPSDSVSAGVMRRFWEQSQICGRWIFSKVV